jgi:hypothetical protein
LPFLPKLQTAERQRDTCINPSIFVSWTVNEKSTLACALEMFFFYIWKIKEDGSFRPGRSSQWRFSRMLFGL